MTPRENFMQMLHNDRPSWLGDPWSCFHCPVPGRPMTPDAVTLMLGLPSAGQVHVRDAWGVCWDFPAGQPGPTPYITEENKVIPDVTRWREYVRFPSLEALPWAAARAAAGEPERDRKLVLAASQRGMFEFSHAMMGFEDTLLNFLVEPEAMYELLDAYTDWKIACAERIIGEMRPDGIMNFDDWANKTQLFLPPRVWREILKPLYKRYFDAIHAHGVLVIQHCDCRAEEIAEDMVDVGIDVWQGVTPENDIPGVIRRTEGKLLCLGGVDMSAIDFPDASEELVRAHIRSVIDRSAGAGHFLPCFTSIRPIHDAVYAWGADEMNRYGAAYVREHFSDTL